MIDFNPVTFTAKPKLIDRPPEIFTVDELRALLEAAQRTQPSVVPMLAIGAFAGLRDAEIKRLDWNEVDLSRGHIEVKVGKAKSARPNCSLEYYRQELTWSDNLILFTESNIARRRCQ